MKVDRADCSPTSLGSNSNHRRPFLKRRPSSDGVNLTELQQHASAGGNNNSFQGNNSSDRLNFVGNTATSVDSHHHHHHPNNHCIKSDIDDDHDKRKDHRGTMARLLPQGLTSIRLVVLLVLCLQNSFFTVLRRYSQGVLKEKYSKYECLMLGEIIKLVFSAYMIGKYDLNKSASQQQLTSDNNAQQQRLEKRLWYLVKTSRKMIVLALIYGIMNILSFVALRNIGAGVFTVIAQCKILTTATFSKLLLHRQYSATKWRALIALVFGVLLFSEPIWSRTENLTATTQNAHPLIGTAAVAIEVTLSGFASIYFEKVIKADALHLSIWERNFQLAMGSLPVYWAFIVSENGGEAGGVGRGWSPVAVGVALLGAAGGLLVALSIKYGDAILKTLATTGAIILSSVLDHVFLGGPLTPIMVIAGVQVVIAICNYTFDATPSPPPPKTMESSNQMNAVVANCKQSRSEVKDEEIALMAAEKQ